MSEQTLLARQPILDLDWQTVGYELLYRNKDGSPPNELFDQTAATCEVLLNTYTGIIAYGTMQVLPAFLNINRETLLKDLPCLSSQNIVLEISANVDIDDAVEQRLRELAGLGFKIALDNFTWRDDIERIKDIVDIIKIDALTVKGKALFHLLEKISEHQIEATLLALKIENISEFTRFKKLGFQLFQGYFFSEPQIISGKRISGNEMIVVQLLAALADPDISSQALESIISRDPRLTVKLLKIVNSASFALQRSISSLNEAIIILGIQELKRWALLVSLSGTLDVPDELCRELLIRAKTLEILAPLFRIEPPVAFMTGIVSGADALFSIPRDELPVHMALSEDVVSALLEGQGNLGMLLEDTIYFNHHEREKLSGFIEENEIQAAQDQAIKWVLKNLQATST